MEKLLSWVTTIGIVLLVLLNFRADVPGLGGNVTPQFSGAQVVNASSSVGANGTLLITNASNSGVWFRISNSSAGRGTCGLTSDTSTLTSLRGQLLVPITSSTGDNVWELYGARGPVSCVGDAGFGVTYSFVTN